MEILWHFGLGATVSFLGSIPPGSINLTLIKTTIEKNFKSAFQFALGVALIELLYCVIAIKFSFLFLVNEHVVLYIKGLSIGVFFVLGISSFRQSGRTKETGDGNKRANSSFLKGALISLFTPLPIPFYIGYCSYFYINGWIVNDQNFINSFIAGTFFGGLLLLCALALIAKNLKLKTYSLNNFSRIMGLIFLLMAAFETCNLIY